MHALRAEIYLERGNNAIVLDEIKKLNAIVYRSTTGERLTNLRAYLVLQASYDAATGNNEGAKDIYRRQDVFTEEEAAAAIRQLDIEQAYRRR